MMQQVMNSTLNESHERATLNFFKYGKAKMQPYRTLYTLLLLLS